MKTLLVSYASKGREDYHKGLLRLIDSALLFDLDIRVYSPDMSIDEYNGVKIIKDMPEGFVGHKDIPYRFKFDLIRQAVLDGYTKIIWLDSSLIIKKDLNELFNHSCGFCFHNLGHPLYKYISDAAVKNLEVSNSELMNVPQVWGGAFGLDFNRLNTDQLFNEIVRQSELGSFNEGVSTREGFIAHRHDQAVLSMLFDRYSVKMYDYGTITTAQHCFPPYEYGEGYIHHLSI